VGVRIRQALNAGEGVLQGGAWVSGFAKDVVWLSAPLLLAGSAAALCVGLLQTGGVITLGKLAPDFSRVNPASGLRNLVSYERLLSVLRAMILALLVGWLVVTSVLEHGRELANSTGNTAGASVFAAVLVRRLLWLAALAGLVLAVLDVAVTRRGWLKRLRMTKDEVRREAREAEGDPEIKAQRRRAHQEMISAAALNAVRDATVLIINPTHIAIALRYLEDQDQAPQVLAQGRGDLALKMIDAARAYGVPVVRDVPVAHALEALQVGDEIPEALYEAIAEILREIWTHSAGEDEGSQS
jgi:flagellar biosynthesis protein FlhB